MVMAIMGLLGAVAVSGYRAMQRGMEERGVMENVNHFIRSAYRRAQIDRQPVAIWFWNETLREETDTETIVVVGKAAAVRRQGRFSRVSDPYLFDEFSDLDKERLIETSDDEESENSLSGSVEGDNLVPIYKMNSLRFGRSLVSQTTKNVTAQNGDTLLSRMKVEEIPCYAYVLQDAGTASRWQTGDAYGFEFAEIQLPHGYIFGDNYHRRPQDKLSASDYEVMWFDVSVNSGSGANQGTAGTATIQVNSFRPGENGEFEVQRVATTERPTEGIHQ